MKRTNLILDTQILETAMSIMKTRTYSDAVNKALAEAVNVYNIRKLYDVFGSGVWDGDLSEMREDETTTKKAKQKNLK